MSNLQWGLKPIQSPRGNSLTDFFLPNEECPQKTCPFSSRRTTALWLVLLGTPNEKYLGSCYSLWQDLTFCPISMCKAQQPSWQSVGLTITRLQIRILLPPIFFSIFNAFFAKLAPFQFTKLQIVQFSQGQASKAIYE